MRQDEDGPQRSAPLPQDELQKVGRSKNEFQRDEEQLCQLWDFWLRSTKQYLHLKLIAKNVYLW